MYTHTIYLCVCGHYTPYSTAAAVQHLSCVEMRGGHITLHHQKKTKVLGLVMQEGGGDQGGRGECCGAAQVAKTRGVALPSAGGRDGDLYWCRRWCRTCVGRVRAAAERVLRECLLRHARGE